MNDKEDALHTLLKEASKSKETFSSHKFNQAFDHCMRLREKQIDLCRKEIMKKCDKNGNP